MLFLLDSILPPTPYPRKNLVSFQRGGALQTTHLSVPCSACDGEQAFSSLGKYHQQPTQEKGLSRLCCWLGGARLSTMMPGDVLALMVTPSHPARQDVAMSTLGQTGQCLEEKTAVEHVLPSQQHQQLQAGLGSHIGIEGRSPRLPHITAVGHRSGPPQEQSLERLCQRKPRKLPATERTQIVASEQMVAQRGRGLGCAAAGAQKAQQMQPLSAHNESKRWEAKSFPSFALIPVTHLQQS